MSALYQKQTKTTSRPHSLTCCKRLASQAFIAKVTAAFSSSPVAPSRASVDRPVSTLCRYLASACAFVSAASSPEPVALRTHFRNPSRIRLRRASRSLRICSCPGEQVLTDNATAWVPLLCLHSYRTAQRQFNGFARSEVVVPQTIVHLTRGKKNRLTALFFTLFPATFQVQEPSDAPLRCLALQQRHAASYRFLPLV